MRFCWDCRSWRSRIGTNFTSESRGNVWDFAEWLTLSKTVVMLSLCSSVQFWYRFSVRAKPIVVDTMAEVRTKCPCQQASFTRQAHVLPPYDVHLVPNLLHAFSALLVICLLHLISIILFFLIIRLEFNVLRGTKCSCFPFCCFLHVLIVNRRQQYRSSLKASSAHSFDGVLLSLRWNHWPILCHWMNVFYICSIMQCNEYLWV